MVLTYLTNAQTKTADGKYIRKDAISDEGLKHFQDATRLKRLARKIFSTMCMAYYIVKIIVVVMLTTLPKSYHVSHA
jgi:hypothetical protein